MATFVALLASGLSLGMIMALVALGFLLLYKATGVINFAHGDLVTLGAYFAVWATVDLGMPTVAGYLVSLLIMFCVGVAIERIAFAPLRRRSQLVVVISTLAAALVIRAAVSLWQGSNPRQLDTPVGNGAWTIFGAHIAVQRVLIVIVAAVVIAAMLLVFHRTSVGRQVRALASDQEMSQLTGVRDRLVSALAFGLSATLAGLAGILVAPLTQVDLTFGFSAMITAFAAAVLGGFGSLAGVVAGGLLIGLVQQLLGGYVFTDYADVLPFVLMFLVIALRPQGLFAGFGRARL
ncbi:MAG: branched-chain amino acid ABC transporter permease [Frankia sp.]|nr:branched-chain amino acid ABC transporter permease [Frankia sp.]